MWFSSVSAPCGAPLSDYVEHFHPRHAVSLHHHVAGHLLDPQLVRVIRDPSDRAPAALEMDEDST